MVEPLPMEMECNYGVADSDGHQLAAGNEDAIAMLMKIETLEAFHMTGKSHDCGSKLGYMKANVEYGFRLPELSEAFTKYIKKLDLSNAVK